MVRRIVEEDVTTPSTTVVEGDGSWVGRTIVALVVIALLIIGGIWLVRQVGGGDPTPGDGPAVENTIDTGDDVVPSPNLS